MRSTTHIHIAFRNVGDSQDIGSFHEGSVSECILWLATKISQISMATRITIGIGRDKADAAKGIEVKGAGQNALNETMRVMLDAVFNEGGSDSVDAERVTLDSSGAAGVGSTLLAGDDYVA